MDKKLNPLNSMEDWEDDLLKRYPENPSEKKEEDFRDYKSSKRAESVKEFYKLNHQYLTI